MQSPPQYHLPARLRIEDSQVVRRVGFELEFSGLTLEQAAQTVAQSLSGTRHVDNIAEQTIQVDGLGRFAVELDWSFLKKQAHQADAESPDSQTWLKPLSRAAAALVPLEVVCPPISMTRLVELEPMVQALRLAGATGTRESIIAAYGLHINIELPSLNPSVLHDYLRAFCLLQWWLVDAHDVDMARRLSPYIDLYPQAYIRQTLQRQKGALSVSQIMEDYIEHNASRNRALDLLPLLAQIDENKVRTVVDDERIKPRPALHYRLPNCQIDQLGWSPAKAWNTWCLVESLANRPQDLDTLGRAFLEAQRWLIGVDRDAWVMYMDQWLRDHVSV